LCVAAERARIVDVRNLPEDQKDAWIPKGGAGHGPWKSLDEPFAVFNYALHKKEKNPGGAIVIWALGVPESEINKWGSAIPGDWCEEQEVQGKRCFVLVYRYNDFRRPKPKPASAPPAPKRQKTAGRSKESEEDEGGEDEGGEDEDGDEHGEPESTGTETRQQKQRKRLNGKVGEAVASNLQEFESGLRRLVQVASELEDEDKLPDDVKSIVAILRPTLAAGNEQVQRGIERFAFRSLGGGETSPECRPLGASGEASPVHRAPAPPRGALRLEVEHASLSARKPVHRAPPRGALRLEVEHASLSAAASAPSGSSEAFAAFAAQGNVVEMLAAGLEELFAAKLPPALQPAVRDLREMLLGG